MADPVERPADSLYAPNDLQLDFFQDARPLSSPLLKEHPAAVLQSQLADAVEVLRRQKEQALVDLDTLAQAKREALADPEGFVARLRSNSLPKFPSRQVVYPLPSMDWPRAVETPQQPSRKRRGDVNTPPMRKSSTIALARLRESDRSSSRSSLQASSTSSLAPPSGNETCKPALAASTDKLTMCAASPPSEEDQQRSTSVMLPPVETTKLRSRPQSQAWTPAEQRRLEQLLVDYPDEPVSTHRWAKIARALGNRTPKQVASRVQQFFVSLCLQNRPLPGGGKPPNMELYLNKQRKDTTKTGESRVRRRNRQPNVAYLQAPAVYMSDDDSVEEESDLADLDDEFKNTEEYKELVRLRRLQAQRRREALVKVVHFDFRCDCCGVDPIEGPRFRCTDCPAGDELDLCEQCLGVDFENGNHVKSHRFERINDARDSDVLFKDEDYSWCDPSDQVQYLNPTFLIS